MACYLKTSTLIDVANQLKNHGKNIVLTHGSFDLLHIGHMEFLKQSKRFGDYLIVGIDSDERIRSYKGRNRPIIPLEQRIEVLLENKSIDFVFAINDSLDMNNRYFIDLYNMFYPSYVTCGRNFGFEIDFKERQKHIKDCVFKKITHKYDKLQSTTRIIEEVTKRYSLN